MKWLLLPAALLACAAPAPAGDKKTDGPITLKLVAKTDTYKFDSGGKTAEEYKKGLDETAKKLAAGERATPPKPLTVDLVLEITNTSKEDVTIYVDGNPNLYTLELTGGAGTVTMNNPVAFPAIFKYPRAVTLAAGKSHEIPVKALADGKGGISRLLFWTGPGEYKLSAKYVLSDKDGGKGAELTSEPVKITVTEK